MRTKPEIMEAVRRARSTEYDKECILEVLIDIRDALNSKEL